MPLHVPKGVKVEHLPLPLLPDVIVPENDQATTMRYWPEARVNSVNCPYLLFVFEGEADLRLGTTESMVANIAPEHRDSVWARCGCHVLQVAAPAAFLVPPGTPVSDGSRPHWEHSRTKRAYSRILWLHILPDRVLCHICTSAENEHTAHHSLQFHDAFFPHLIDMLQDELKLCTLHHDRIAHNLLEMLLLRLHRHLTLQDPIVANTAWASSPYMRQRDSSRSLPPAVEEAAAFIQSHLHENIALAQVAAHCCLSPRQLNRLFRAALDTTVKEYINRQKIEAARQMLTGTDMSTKEISALLGFSQASHFCHLFRHYTKLSPGLYRKRA
jgi:AraC-like DNA-binding protein